MANHTGSNIPETDTTPIPILLPRNRRYDQQPATYVVTVFADLPSTNLREGVTPIDQGRGAEIHPAYYAPATGTIPSKTEAIKEAESEGTTPEQQPHCPTEPRTETPAGKTPTDSTALAKLLDEIYQTRHCPRCHTTHRAKPCPMDPLSSCSSCYYHRHFGTSARKCRPPCSFPGQYHGSTP